MHVRYTRDNYLNQADLYLTLIYMFEKSVLSVVGGASLLWVYRWSVQCAFSRVFGSEARSALTRLNLSVYGAANEASVASVTVCM